MADSDQPSPAMDMDQHARSFGLFMRWLKIGAIASAIVTAIVIAIIV